MESIAAKANSIVQSLEVELANTANTLLDVEEEFSNATVADSAVKRLRELRESQYEIRSSALPRLQSALDQAFRQISKLRSEREHIILELTKANDRYHEIRLSESHRLGCLLLWPLRLVKRTIGSLGKTQETFEIPPTDGGKSNSKLRELHEEHSFYKAENPYQDVSNEGTSLAALEDWVSVFHYKGRRYGSNEPLVSDQLPPIDKINSIYPYNGKHILELGSLEGANTKQMLDLGAASVTAIEFNKDFFLKSLAIKNEFQLNNAEFILGDLNLILTNKKVGHRDNFDFCLCSGLLYHMENPVRTIDLICRHAPAVYVWSHVASKKRPAGKWVTITDLDGHKYRGCQNIYKDKDSLGGTGRGAVWLTPESMTQCFEDRGYKISHKLLDENYKGERIEFLALKSI